VEKIACFTGTDCDSGDGEELIAYFSGTFTDSGDGVSHVLPINDGFVLRQAISGSDFAGRDRSVHLMNNNMVCDHSLAFVAECERVGDALEIYYNIVLDYDSETTDATERLDKEMTCEMSGGIYGSIGSRRLGCPGVLFVPSRTGKEASGFHDTSLRSSRPLCLPRCSPLVRVHIVWIGDFILTALDF